MASAIKSVALEGTGTPGAAAEKLTFIPSLSRYF